MGAAASDYFTSYADVQYGFLDAELGIENFHLLAANGDFHGVSVCLKKGLDPNGIRFEDDDDFARQDTPMICAARGHPLKRGCKRHVKTLDVLLRFGGNINKWNYLEQTPLYVACEKNLVRIVQWLVTHGADVNKATKVGVSPLLCALRNENLVIAKLLLDAGAKAIDLPQNFSRIRFPTVAKELRGENTDEQSDSDSEDSESSTEQDEESAARPTSSYRLLRPLWPPKKKPDSPETAPGLPKDSSPQPTQQQQLLREAIEAQQRLQHDCRALMLHALHDQRLLEDQRQYRAKNAVDNAKRKDKKRRARDKANYERYIARVEQKRLECRLEPLRPTTAVTTETVRPSTTPAASVHSNLRWAVQQQSGVHRSRTAGSGVPRPKWVTHELTTIQVQGNGSVKGDAVMLHQCEQIQRSLDAERERRERSRAVYTAPLDAAAVKRGRKPSTPSTELGTLPPV